MKIVFSHSTGNQNVRQVALALAGKEALDSFHTTFATFDSDCLHRLGSIPFLGEIRRRTYDPALRSYTHSYPYLEIGRILAQKFGLKQLIRHEFGLFSVDAIYRDLDSRVVKYLKRDIYKQINAVYAYEDGALESFQIAKKLGIACIYDLPIAYWEKSRQLLFEEAQRLPTWAATLGGGIEDSEEKLQRKAKELELADMVICPSAFVSASLPDWAASKKFILSAFGSPTNQQMDSTSDESLTLNNSMRPLRVLFVGSMGQRKGLADLFAAIKLLNTKNIQLVVMGSLSAPMEFYRAQLPDFIYEPGRSHEEVLALMRTCDILCLPSIVEGRALVMQEAMSQGLPLIITPNTGGEDLIIEEETGFLVPISSPEAIADKLNWFLEHRLEIPQMGQKAKEHASTYTWKKYADTIVDGIKKDFGNV